MKSYDQIIEEMGESYDLSRKYVLENEQELRREYENRKIAVLDGELIGVSKDEKGFSGRDMLSFQNYDPEDKIHLLRPVLIGTIEEIVNPPIYIFNVA